MLSVKKETEIAFQPEALRDAFEKFSEASSRLEERYASLLRETEELKAQLKEKDAEARRNEKLAMLGQTAAAVAHEVRNPLGAIKLFASLLKRDVKDAPASLELVNEMERSVDAIEHVVSNILQFAKEAPVSLSPVNIRSIAQEVLSHFSSSSQSGPTLECHFEGSEFMLGNEHSLRQVLHNLILNALQATKHKGKISVSSRETASGIELKVKDNGPGIPKALETQLFEPFVTSKPEGTGLGLAIVRKIVEQHGGSIRAQNNGGAEFVMTFPVRR